MRQQLGTSVGLALIALGSQAFAALPTLDEMTDQQRFAAAKFRAATQPPPTGLVVVANHDNVLKDAWCGKLLNIAGAVYERGLFCHAQSELVVRLPAPGKTFTAEVGVCSNLQTVPGRGTIVFSMAVDGKQQFRSPMMREGMAALPVKVDLNGAEEFVIAVDDAGDGISCDQAVWGSARVTLSDGRALWLSALPILEGQQPVPVTDEPPFSFTCGGQPSAELLKAWELKHSHQPLDPQRVQHTLTWTDPDTGLVVRCVAVQYLDFPTVEWTVYLRNAGDKDAPILENIQALDLTLQRYPLTPVGTDKLGEFALYHHSGDNCTPESYRPHRTVLDPKATLRFAPDGGRPTNGRFPYFNVEWLSEGLICVVGWSGQWAAEFTRDEQVGLRIRAGQEQTHLRLRPGEEIRTPLVALQFWKGDRVRSQNVWRRWMVAHNLPRAGGKLPPPQWNANSSLWYGEMVNANEENQKMFVDRYLKERMHPDYWWMDAGWYIQQQGWPHVGTWEVDTKRFPRGLRAISDYIRTHGIKTLVWFEPERVTAGTWLFENRQPWLLGRGSTRLLNLGSAEAWQWLTDHIHRLLTEQVIDLYRQDFNMDPLDFWRGNDAPDRQGMTEQGHVAGYLAFWDELRKRSPNLVIDSCASGGRRNDLETLRRAVPLLRSDYIFEPTAQQCHFYGIAFWFPFFGTPTVAENSYGFRSNMAPVLTTGWDMRRKDLPYDLMRRLTSEWQQVAPYFITGDYYPLTAYSLDNDDWMGWQFNVPEKDEGVVQVFRRPDSIYLSAQLRLRGLDPDAIYEVTNLDNPKTRQRLTGRALAQRGLPVTIESQPGAVTFVYRLSSTPGVRKKQ